MNLVCAVPQVYLEWLGHKVLRNLLGPGGMMDQQVDILNLLSTLAEIRYQQD